MKKQRYLLFIVFLFSLVNTPLDARHIISGTMSYKCLGNNQYQITMIIYKDCFDPTGAPLDFSVPVGIYRGGVLLGTEFVSIALKQGIAPAPYEDCAANFPTYCVEKGTYFAILTLEPSTETYTIVHQRCCWANSVANVDKPDERGISIAIEVTPAAMAVCNSSPQIDFPLAFASCPNVPISLDLQGNEIEGDSLSYELCMPFQGGGLDGSPDQPGDSRACSGVTPTPPCGPPYTTLPFADGFDLNNPFPTANGITFDPLTGTLDFVPTAQGRFVFGLCISEYRDGVLLGRYISTMLSSNQMEGVISNVQEQNKATKWTLHHLPGATNAILKRDGYTPLSNTTIELLGANGQILSNFQSNGSDRLDIPLTQYASGLYLIRIQEGHHQEVHKVVLSQ